MYLTFARSRHTDGIARLINEESERSGALMKVDRKTVRGWIGSGLSVIALSEGGIVAHQALNVWRRSGWAELRLLVVEEGFRGRGIGYKLTKMLMKKYMRRHREATFVALKNKTERGNGILLALGFRQVSLENVPEELFSIRSHSERRAFVARFGKDTGE